MNPVLATPCCILERIRDYVLIVQSADSASDEEWAEIVAFQTVIPADRARVLVWTDGGYPTARQRTVLNAALNGGQPRTVVLTASRLARSIGIAISWFNPQVRLYSPSEIESAIDHLGALGADRQLLKDTLADLRSELALRAMATVR